MRKKVNNKRMASEIPTNMLKPKKYIILILDNIIIRALVICGLLKYTKIFT
jgi:hypothetical protein